MTLEEITANMEYNGYAYFDKDAFYNDAPKVCYVPENAESIEDAYTYLDLRDAVDKFTKDNPEWLEENDINKETLLIVMFQNLSWEFPETYLEGLNN
jgi:hypothetical protein